MSKGKSKGNAFERLISTKLSDWWTEGVRSDIFWRSTNSGGRATVRSKKGKSTAKQHGDICAIDPIGEPLLKVVAIELKRGYNAFSLADLLDKPKNGSKQTYENWIEQAEQARANSGALYWMIIAKRDRREPIIIMPMELKYELLSVKVYFDYDAPYMEMEVPWGKEDWLTICAFGFEQFLKYITPLKILDLAEDFVNDKTRPKNCASS